MAVATNVRGATPADLPRVRALIEEYCRWIDLDLAFQEIEPELDALPGDYAPPAGALLVAEVNGRIEALVAYRRFDEGIAEMKRLYVAPAVRGLGLARALATTLLEQARTSGYHTMYLDTLTKMGDAQRLYESLGFRDIPPYYDTPLPNTRFMACRLNPIPYN
jgi:ribosomal protein S18 acetylase RimI-like enzyme